MESPFCIEREGISGGRAGLTVFILLNNHTNHGFDLASWERKKLDQKLSCVPTETSGGLAPGSSTTGLHGLCEDKLYDIVRKLSYCRFVFVLTFFQTWESYDREPCGEVFVGFFVEGGSSAGRKVTGRSR